MRSERRGRRGPARRNGEPRGAPGMTWADYSKYRGQCPLHAGLKPARHTGHLELQPTYSATVISCLQTPQMTDGCACLDFGHGIALCPAVSSWQSWQGHQPSQQAKRKATTSRGPCQWTQRVWGSRGWPRSSPIISVANPLAARGIGGGRVLQGIANLSCAWRSSSPAMPCCCARGPFGTAGGACRPHGSQPYTT